MAFSLWFALLTLVMSTIVFSGGIRWSSTGSLCMCLCVARSMCFLSGCEGRCDLCVTRPGTGLFPSACQNDNLHRFSYREKRGWGRN